MDFSWLEYIGNPYSVIAVIAAILGFSFKNLLKKIEKPKPQFILAMYGMFLISILAIGIGGMALVFFIKGEGASEMIANQQNHTFGFFRTAYAETGLSKTDASLTKIKINGWIWAGETTKVENKISETQTQSINKANSQILEVRTIPQKIKSSKPKQKPIFVVPNLDFLGGDFTINSEN